MEKVIIDTDIGDDIDDALALALALKAPELDVLGITTVFRNSVLRARITAKLLKTFGREEIPVCAGMDIPFIQTANAFPKDQFDENGRPIPCQYIAESMEDCEYSKEWAPDFMIRSVMEHPHEVTVIAIGPLTNVAAALRKRPEIIPLIKKIVLMGGVVSREYPEWNILCDPEAAKIVYSCGAPVYAVGLDVTEQCKMSLGKVDELYSLEDETCRFLSDLMKRWFAFFEFEQPCLHDPLTVAAVICDRYVSFSKRKVEVQLEGALRGMTKTVEGSGDAGTFIFVAEKVDSSGFMSYFEKQVFGSKLVKKDVG